MKRRGFLGFLTGLVALPGVVVAAVTRKPDATVMEITGATTIESLPFKQPDPALFALTEQIRRDLDAEYVGHAWYLKGGENIPMFERSSNREVTRARIQEALDRIVGVPGL